MVKIIKISIIILFTLTGVLLILNAYGLFTDVTFSKHRIGPYLLVFDKWEGDYKVTGAVMKKVSNQLQKEHGITCSHQFGLYFDNPEKVQTEKLRSIGGCVVKEKTFEDLEALRLKHSVYQFPQTQAVASEFPFKGQLSIVFGLMKVYPRLSEYLQTHHLTPGAIMELYDNEKITYIAPTDIPKKSLEALLDVDMNQQGQSK